MKHYLQLCKIPDANQWRILHFYLPLKRQPFIQSKGCSFSYFFLFTIAIIVFNNTTNKGQNYALRIYA